MVAKYKLPNFVIDILTVSLFCIDFSADCELGMFEFQKGYHWDREVHDSESKRRM